MNNQKYTCDTYETTIGGLCMTVEDWKDYCHIYKAPLNGLHVIIEDWKGYIPVNSDSPIYCRWWVYSPNGQEILSKGNADNVEAAFAVALEVAAIVGGEQ